VPETQAATETSAVVEVAARPGKVLTRTAAAESPAGTAEMASAKAAAHMTAGAEPTAHMTAAEPTAHMTATAKTAGVSTPSAASAGARGRVSGQAAGEHGSRSQNDHDFTQHYTSPFGRDRVRSTENIVATVGADFATRSMTPHQNVVRRFRVVLRPYRINRWGSARVSLSYCHCRSIGRPQDQSNQGNTDEVIFLLHD
jgi:hypothetical protein